MHYRPLIVLLLLTAWLPSCAQSPVPGGYQPTADNLAAREWFQNARFGLFIHWGVYSTLGDGEWVMNDRKIPLADYEKLPALFNPVAYDPKAWVSMAKAAGMRYITITSKHHDGFAMFDSKVSDYNIVARTPYAKDPLKLLAEECQRQGIKLFFYHSHLDWHHPDYVPQGNTGRDIAGRSQSGSFAKYVDYMNAQLTELLTNYGPIAGIWFDGWWDQKDKVDWQLEKTYALIHRLQPAALIGNNHHMAPFAGEDFQMYEKDLPGQNTTGFSGEAKVGQLPLEVCETMNGAWGFNLKDNRYKSTKDLIQYLVNASGHGANFLLNVGPMPNGKIQPEFVKTLGEMGTWMATYGETIYGTRQGPIAPRDWGVTTAKGSKVYVHVLKWADESLTLPKLPTKVKSARLFKDKSPVAFVQNDFGVTLKLTPAQRDAVDTVVELER